MRIAFILIGNSRRSNYLNGDTLRNKGGGGSGTDTSTILVAEFLASQGHEVVIATEKLEPALEVEYARQGKFFPKGETVRGVKYTDIEFNFIDDKEFDILVNSLWFHDYEKLPIKVKKSLIYWCHMQWIYGIDQMLHFCKKNNLTLGFVNISNWEKSMNLPTITTARNNYDRVYDTLIPNPICDDVIKEVKEQNINKKSHKFVFHASWARGGNVAVEVINQLPFTDKELHAFDYLITIHDHKLPFFHRHDGVDKNTLYKHIAESEYFLYPLYTPYQDVHKDTFSCVVAEAIALGAIPITYPVGALKENFDNYCHWIDLPEKTNLDTIQLEPLTKDVEGLFKNNIDNIKNSILYLENNPDVKYRYRQNGYNFIMDSFNTRKIGKMWEEYFKLL